MRNEEKINSYKPTFINKSGLNTKKINKSGEDNISTNFKTGTTTVGLICKDAIILGTDKRATMAYFVASKISEKLYEIQEHLWMTTAGGVADAQYLVDVLRAETSIFQLKHDGKPMLVKSAGKLLSNILYQNKMFPFEVGLILGGVTKEEGPTLLVISAYGSILPEKYCAVGSGQNFSYGVLEARYKDDLTIEEGKEIVKKAITSSIIRDMASGNGIDIAIIKEEGSAEREFIPI
ncbi:MAG: proteasome subunit beta [Promethearchaeota archaeon]|nr:MAG: proteasome subunit beta [Candidatus Lokiarchaeota archaeon]